MKKITFFIAGIFCSTICVAQQTPSATPGNSFPKTISVSGSASIEIVPDEIFVNIRLHEYQKKGEGKKDLETIRNQFLESCQSARIADSNVSIISYSGAGDYYHFKKRKKDPNMFSSIEYQVKFSNAREMDALVEKLDDDATQYFTIAYVTHSKMADIRKELKIKATQAAREKANYLAGSVNEKAGEAISIVEPEDIDVPRTYENNNSMMAFAQLEMKRSAIYTNQSDIPSEVDFKKMKLRYTVNAVFALK